MGRGKLADVRKSKTMGNFEALFTIDNEENERSYVLYTHHSIDEEGNINVYASFFDGSRGTEELYPLESDEEWKMMEEILTEVERGLQEGLEEEEMSEEDFLQVDLNEKNQLN